MSNPHDVEVELRFLTAQEGGRTQPVQSGYRPQLYYAGRDWDAEHYYPDADIVHPGDTVRAYLTLLSPEAHIGKLRPGMKFQCREGHRVVAEGRVIRIFDLARQAPEQS